MRACIAFVTLLLILSAPIPMAVANASPAIETLEQPLLPALLVAVERLAVVEPATSAGAWLGAIQDLHTLGVEISLRATTALENRGSLTQAEAAHTCVALAMLGQRLGSLADIGSTLVGGEGSAGARDQGLRLVSVAREASERLAVVGCGLAPAPDAAGAAAGFALALFWAQELSRGLDPSFAGGNQASVRVRVVEHFERASGLFRASANSRAAALADAYAARWLVSQAETSTPDEAIRMLARAKELGTRASSGLSPGTATANKVDGLLLRILALEAGRRAERQPEPSPSSIDELLTKLARDPKPDNTDWVFALTNSLNLRLLYHGCAEPNLIPLVRQLVATISGASDAGQIAAVPGSAWDLDATSTAVNAFGALRTAVEHCVVGDPGLRDALLAELTRAAPSATIRAQGRPQPQTTSPTAAPPDALVWRLTQANQDLAAIEAIPDEISASVLLSVGAARTIAAATAERCGLDGRAPIGGCAQQDVDTLMRTISRLAARFEGSGGLRLVIDPAEPFWSGNERPNLLVANATPVALAAVAHANHILRSIRPVLGRQTVVELPLPVGTYAVQVSGQPVLAVTVPHEWTAMRPRTTTGGGLVLDRIELALEGLERVQPETPFMLSRPHVTDIEKGEETR
jgi:hypothetical protein